jgi:predicted nuclease with TOPRIM domain
MNVITIHTDNENQISLLQTLLSELKIKFEINHKEELTDLQKEKILKGINDIEMGYFSASEIVQKRAKKCFK